MRTYQEIKKDKVEFIENRLFEEIEQIEKTIELYKYNQYESILVYTSDNKNNIKMLAFLLKYYGYSINVLISKKNIEDYDLYINI